MSRITPSKVTTLVVQVLVSICAPQISSAQESSKDDANSLSGLFAGQQIPTKEKVLEMIEMNCNPKNGPPWADDLNLDPKATQKQCIAAVTAHAYRFNANGNSTEKTCRDDYAKYQELEEKFDENCSKGGLSTASCIKKAGECNDDRSDALGGFEEDDDEENSWSYSGKSCKERYPDCPELGLLDSEDIKERETTLRDEFRDRRERVRDLEKQQRDNAKEAADDFQNLLEDQTRIRARQSKQVQELDEAKLRTKQEKVGAIQAIREQYLAIDTQLTKIQADFLARSIEIEKGIRQPNLKCEKEAEAEFLRQTMASRASKKTGDNITNDFNKLARAKRKSIRVASARKTYCKSTAESKESVILANQYMATLKAEYANQTALLERRRANLVIAMQEREMLAAEMDERLRQSAAANIQQLETDYKQAEKNFLRSEQQRQTEAVYANQQLMEEKNEMGEWDRKLFLAKLDSDCVDSFRRKSGNSPETAKNVIEALQAAPSLQKRIERACAVQKISCGKIGKDLPCDDKSPLSKPVTPGATARGSLKSDYGRSDSPIKTQGTESKK